MEFHIGRISLISLGKKRSYCHFQFNKITLQSFFLFSKKTKRKTYAHCHEFHSAPKVSGMHIYKVNITQCKIFLWNSVIHHIPNDCCSCMPRNRHRERKEKKKNINLNFYVYLVFPLRAKASQWIIITLVVWLWWMVTRFCHRLCCKNAQCWMLKMCSSQLAC